MANTRCPGGTFFVINFPSCPFQPTPRCRVRWRLPRCSVLRLVHFRRWCPKFHPSNYPSNHPINHPSNHPSCQPVGVPWQENWALNQLFYCRYTHTVYGLNITTPPPPAPSTAAAVTTTAANTAGSRNPNLKHLLFYTCVTPQIGNQCEEVQ